MSRRLRWRVVGPCFADGWWYVEDSWSTYPELGRVWCRVRREARELATARNRTRARYP